MNRDLKLSEIELKECNNIMKYNNACLIWGDDFYIRRSLLHIAINLSKQGMKVVFYTLTSYQLDSLSELLNRKIVNGTKAGNILFTTSKNRKISFDNGYDVLICEYTDLYTKKPFGIFKKQYYGGYAKNNTVFEKIVNSDNIEYKSIIKYNEFDDEYYIHENKERNMNSKIDSKYYKSIYLCDWSYPTK